jgi:hypothetical protein
MVRRMTFGIFSALYFDRHGEITMSNIESGKCAHSGMLLHRGRG